ncbi:BTB/POZ protein [Glomus cerebriforme]|uniref:BTB/POZ protein n=1 Tax=Glomus cerebriforme TaxID=658196 RepID=A0A397SD70_9GLOM|nr:BTB/POZ protein [Glomus cerebriforme]
MSSKLSNILHEEYNDILESTEFYDTEIVIGKGPIKVFKVHSLILKIRSPYFRTALSDKWVKTENNIIKLKNPNISVKIFDILIKYIYSSIVDITENDIKTNVELLIAADELCLIDLCTFIEEYFLKNKALLKQNFVLIQDIATKFTHFKKLSQFYLSNFQRKPSLIFKAKDFTTIKKDILLNLLVKNNHSLKTIKIWDKLIEWCIAQSSELSSDVKRWKPSEVATFGDLLRPFIPYIDFKEIAASDFSQKIRPFKDIFDTDFYVKILEYYSFDNKNKRRKRSGSLLSSDDSNFSSSFDGSTSLLFSDGSNSSSSSDGSSSSSSSDSSSSSSSSDDSDSEHSLFDSPFSLENNSIAGFKRKKKKKLLL